MAKRKYMVCYDVSDDKRRNKIVRELLKIGIRTQYSVFEAEITESQLEIVLSSIEKKIDKKEDSVIAYPLSEKSYKKVIRVGNNINYLPTDDIFV